MHATPALTAQTDTTSAAVMPASTATLVGRRTRGWVQRAALCAALVCAVPGAALATATVVYDPRLGTLPSQQAWLPLVLGGAATQAVANGAYTLDTTGATVGLWGNGQDSWIQVDDVVVSCPTPF